MFLFGMPLEPPLAGIDGQDFGHMRLTQVLLDGIPG